MIYNKHYLNVVVRVSLITITSLGISFSIYRVGDLLLIFNLIVLLGLEVILFTHAMNKTNADLEAFFSSLENNDTTVSLKALKNYASYEKLMERMKLLKDKFNHMRIENERQFQYFKAVVENTGVGLVLCNTDGKIELINEAGKRILGITQLTKLTELNVYNETLAETLMNLNSGQQKLFRLNLEGTVQPIAFKVNDYHIFEKTLRIISFQNIKNELNAQELESWQKLIRVITHEIMNSTGPIISSIDTIKEFLTDDGTHDIKKLKDIQQETLRDVISGIEIIKERSIGLSEFVKNFRSLTISPKILPSKFRVEELFRHIQFLLSEELKKRKIELEISILPKNLEIFADLKLMEQVMLNLVYNAMDATVHAPRKQITLKAHKNMSDQHVLQVIDHGKGIPEEFMDKIFVPFFTTKEKGSGIGLSISQQIIQLHGGSIQVQSSPATGTCFEICFLE